MEQAPAGKPLPLLAAGSWGSLSQAMADETCHPHTPTHHVADVLQAALVDEVVHQLDRAAVLEEADVVLVQAVEHVAQLHVGAGGHDGAHCVWVWGFGGLGGLGFEVVAHTVCLGGWGRGARCE